MAKGVVMQKAQGFTLIELMIVVAIIAILAAVGIPAYQDYAARSQVTEAFSLAGDARTAVTVFHTERSTYPVDNEDAGLADPSSITGRYVAAVTVGAGSGHVEVLLGNNASDKITGQTMIMQLHNQSGSLRWDCGGIDPKYLPSVCR